MSTRNISQSINWSIIKLSHNFIDYFKITNRSEWVNGRPILLNGDVWCPMCETWHANNTHCQQQGM